MCARVVYLSNNWAYVGKYHVGLELGGIGRQLKVQIINVLHHHINEKERGDVKIINRECRKLNLELRRHTNTHLHSLTLTLTHTHTHSVCLSLLSLSVSLSISLSAHSHSDYSHSQLASSHPINLSSLPLLTHSLTHSQSLSASPTLSTSYIPS